MPTLHFWNKAPDGQWPVATQVQELYKEIYPAHPDGVMAGDLPYHRLWRLATLSSTVILPNGFMALLLQHFILARHTCPAAVFFLSQSNPAQAFLFEPTALSEESYNELTRITPLVEKYAHSIMRVGFLSTVMAQLPEYSKAWCNKVFLEALEEPLKAFNLMKTLFFVPYFHHTMDAPHILSCFWTVYEEIHPPFEKAIIRPMGLSHRARQLDELCTGNQEAYFALFLQFNILCSQEDPFLRNTAMRLDPLQDLLYLAPQTNESTFHDILDAQIGPYAQAIAEIGVLSVSTALIPGAPRAWVDAVFNAIPVLTPHEAVPVRMFFFNPANAIERMTRPYTSPPSEAVNFSNESL
ncbi:hypothetical protein PQX77_014922 [Marasmius sp. AFHP31]|nr:hypothetical protein PQX77_014922 [Marasmius sp. AFHP31]